LEDGSQAIYRVDADGRLSLVLGEGDVIGGSASGLSGQVAHLGAWEGPQGREYRGVSLNNKGQVALPVQTAGGVPTVVLLTPTAPTTGSRAEQLLVIARARRQIVEVPAPGAGQQDVNAASLSRLHQLAKALTAYEWDHDEQLPPLWDAATAKKALLPYVRGGSALVHPQTGEPYQPNPTLSRQSLASTAEPWKMAVFWEARPGADGTRGVVFVDGHVRRVPEAEWPEIRRASKIR
jgi:prepilin-type processing-associated H-X9-DG protein